jgi:hypothetical protein
MANRASSRYRLASRRQAKKALHYRKLRNFRAGIEAGISCLKRAYGLARCTWRGLDHFKTYVWSSVVADNLVLFARLKPIGITTVPAGRRPQTCAPECADNASSPIMVPPKSRRPVRRQLQS